MWYRTKKEILEHLGKDGKDVRYLDRAVASGEIIVRDRMYIVSKEYIEELEKKQTENKVIEPKVDKNDNQEKIAELESDLNFQISENEKLEKKVATFQECIRNCYRWAQNVKKDKTPRPEFKEKVLKLNDNLPGEDNQ